MLDKSNLPFDDIQCSKKSKKRGDVMARIREERRKSPRFVMNQLFELSIDRRNLRSSPGDRYKRRRPSVYHGRRARAVHTGICYVYLKLQWPGANHQNSRDRYKLSTGYTK